MCSDDRDSNHNFSNFFFSFSRVEENGDTNKTIVDLAKQGLKKIPKNEDNSDVRQLILDENELQKFDNIDSYLKVEKVRPLAIFFPLIRPFVVIVFCYDACKVASDRLVPIINSPVRHSAAGSVWRAYTSSSN